MNEDEAVEIMLQAHGKESIEKDFDDIATSAEKAGKRVRSVWDLIDKATDVLGPGNLIQSFKDILSPDLDVNSYNGVTESLDSVQRKASDAINAVKSVNDAISGIEDNKVKMSDITDATGPIKAADAIKAFNEVKAAMQEASSKGLADIMKQGLPSMNLQMQIPAFEGGGLESLAEVSDIKAIQDTILQLDRAIESINGKEIHPLLKNDALANLTRYKEMLEQLNQTQTETSEVGGSKLTQFLDRYKYSLLLIGGALGTIVGMMRYSTVFGTSLDILGQAVGYLADSILFPLLPAIMYLAEWIIGLADWFNGLPDPIKMAISALTLLGIGLYLLGGPIGTAIALLKKFLAFLSVDLTAGALAGAAGVIRALALITISLIAAYAIWQGLAKTGIIDTLESWVAGLKKQHPVIASAIRLIFAGLLTTGAIFVDLFTGQWDRIPEHIMGIFNQLKDDLATVAPVVMSPLLEIRKGALETFKAIQDAIGLDTTRLDVDIAQVNLAIDNLKKNQDEAIRRTTERSTFNPETQIKATDSDVLNGIYAEDQVRAYLKRMKALEEEYGLGTDVQSIVDKYEGGIGDTDYLKQAAGYVDMQKNLQDLNTEFNNGAISADEYSKKLKGLMGDLSGVNAAAQAVKAPTDKVLKTGDFFRTDDRDTPGSISVNEMMKSRYDKIMHDYHTQSKYKNDAYLNPVNKAVKEVQQPVKVVQEVTNPIDEIIKEAVPTTPVKVPVQIEPELVSEIQISKENFMLGSLSQLNPLFNQIWKMLRGDDWAKRVNVPLNNTLSDVSGQMGPEMEYIGKDLKMPSVVKSVPVELPSGPAPSSTRAPDKQSVVNNYETVNHNHFTINGYQKDARQLADEIAKIWDQKSRGSRI